MEDQLYKTILKDTFTARRLQKRLRVLKGMLLTKLYGRSDKQPIDQVELDEEQSWLQSLEPGVLNQIDKDNLSPVFNNLENRIKNSKLLTIYIAFDMPKDELNRLGLTLRQTYGEQFLFDVKFDPNVIGGVALVWNGIYKDYSVRSLIGQRKSDILSAFRNFVGRSQ